MRRKGIIGLVIILVVLLSAPAAFARLAAVGLLNPPNGFPIYYVDTNGIALEMTAPPFGTPVGGAITAPTMVFDAPVAGNTFSQRIGFGTEARYYSCVADPNLTTAFGKFTFEIGLLASFADSPTPIAQNGNQAVFSRIRCTVSGPKLPAGIYTLRHPYGVETIVVSAGKGLSFARDIPLPTKLDFTTALGGDVGPFLAQSPLPGTFPVAPPFNTGWIGDGVTVGPITGSPIAFNQVRLDAPRGVNLDGAGHSFVATTNFIVSGHQYPNAIATPLSVNRLTYTRDATNIFLDLFATSVLGANVTAQFVPPTETPLLPGGPGIFAGLFFGRAQLPTATTTLPFFVQVTGTAGTSAASIIFKQTVDLVTITQAVWHAGTQTATITANSSDTLAPPPNLTVTDPPWGPMVNGGLNVVSPIPPPTVTVSSSAGGAATELVQIVTP